MGSGSGSTKAGSPLTFRVFAAAGISCDMASSARARANSNPLARLEHCFRNVRREVMPASVGREWRRKKKAEQLTLPSQRGSSAWLFYRNIKPASHLPRGQSVTFHFASIFIQDQTLW